MGKCLSPISMVTCLNQNYITSNILLDINFFKLMLYYPKIEYYVIL